MTEANDEQRLTLNPSKSAEFFEKLKDVADYYGVPDRLLQQIADLANGGGAGKGIPITLFLSGGMISGHIESGQDFLRGMAELYREGATNSNVEGELPEAADDFARSVYEARAMDVDDEIEAERRAFDEHGTKSARWLLTRQLHLKDAYHTVPGATSIRQPHICVQLSHVAGWTLGVTSWG
jgi:hypothetical protein